MDANNEFMAGTSLDEAVLLDRPGQEAVALVLQKITGSPVGIELGYNMGYVRNFILTCNLPSDPKVEFPIHMTVDDWVNDKDTPYRGLVSTLRAPTNNDGLEIMKNLALHFGGWTRRTKKTKTDYLLVLSPETSPWEFHSQPDFNDPVLDAELGIEKLFHPIHSQAIYAVMQDKESLNEFIDTLVKYREAAQRGVGRNLGSGERIREQETFQKRNWGGHRVSD